MLRAELRMDLTGNEAAALITRFDVDNSGHISVDEFARFLQGDLSIDRQELVVKLQGSFRLCERNGMSVVKLFTAVDKQNVGVVPFNAVRAILLKYIGTSLSAFEQRILQENYAAAMDENQCRYTDLYSDVMTARAEEEEAAEAAGADRVAAARAATAAEAEVEGGPGRHPNPNPYPQPP